MFSRRGGDEKKKQGKRFQVAHVPNLHIERFICKNREASSTSGQCAG